MNILYIINFFRFYMDVYLRIYFLRKIKQLKKISQ